MPGTGWRTHTSVDLYLGAPVEVEVRPHDVERPFVVVELRDAELTVLVVAGVSRLIEGWCRPGTAWLPPCWSTTGRGSAVAWIGSSALSCSPCSKRLRSRSSPGSANSPMRRSGDRHPRPASRQPGPGNGASRSARPRPLARPCAADPPMRHLRRAERELASSAQARATGAPTTFLRERLTPRKGLDVRQVACVRVDPGHLASRTFPRER
jgi:hypothetical protein